jgi:hypothetical protein
MPGPSRTIGSVQTARRSERTGAELQFDRGALSAIYIIDIIRWRRSSGEPEILSRILRHAANPEAAKEEGRKVLKGVDFLGAEAVRILDSDGVELFLSRLTPTGDGDA